MVQQVGEVSSTVSWACLGNLFTRYVRHSSRSVVTPGVRATRRTLNGYPNGLLVKCYGTDVASLIKECSTRPEILMVPESRPTPESSSSAHFSTASHGNEVTSTNYLYITVIIKLGIK